MNDFQYEEFKDSQLWSVIERSLDDLIKDRNIEVSTDKECAVGYICKRVFDEFGKNKFCDFSFDEPGCFSDNDIIEVGSAGISLGKVSFINFRECARNFERIKGGSGHCVGERDITDLSFTFYASPKAVTVRFAEKNKPVGWLSANNARQRFLKLEKQLLDLGYTTLDRS